MSKHTGTPWFAGENSVPTQMEKGSHTILIESDGYIIAHVSSWRNDPETAKEAFANANLIASAPDMLEALQAARDLWGDYLPPGNSNAMKAMKMVDSAIAKATGESK